MRKKVERVWINLRRGIYIEVSYIKRAGFTEFRRVVKRKKAKKTGVGKHGG